MPTMTDTEGEKRMSAGRCRFPGPSRAERAERSAEKELDASISYVERVFARDGESWHAGPEAQALILRRLESIPRYLLALGKARLVPLREDDMARLSRRILQEVHHGFQEVEHELSLEEWIYIRCHHEHTAFIEKKIRGELLHLMMRGRERIPARHTGLIDRLGEAEESLRLTRAIEALPAEDRLILYRAFHLGLPRETHSAERGLPPEALDQRIDEALRRAASHWPRDAAPWIDSMAAPARADSTHLHEPPAPEHMRACLEREERLWSRVGEALSRNHMDKGKIRESLKEMLGLTAENIQAPNTHLQRALAAAVTMAAALIITFFLQVRWNRGDFVRQHAIQRTLDRAPAAAAPLLPEDAPNSPLSGSLAGKAGRAIEISPEKKKLPFNEKP